MAPTTHLDATEAGAQITRGNLQWGTELGAASGPITFGFRSSAPSVGTSVERTTFSRVTAAEMAAVEDAMRLLRMAGGMTSASDYQEYIEAAGAARRPTEVIALIEEGLIDILFSNEGEIRSLTQLDDFDAAVAALAPKVPVLVSTRSEKGAVAVVEGTRYQVPAAPVAQVVDTTGAGDLFAAGFLAGHIAGQPVETCLSMGAAAAAEVISHFGARPEADLKELVAPLLA